MIKEIMVLVIIWLVVLTVLHIKLMIAHRNVVDLIELQTDITDQLVDMEEMRVVNTVLDQKVVKH